MLIPRPDQVAITPIYDPEMVGSLYVPDMAKERVDQGIVKYVGSSCKWLEVGEYVLFSPYAGGTVQLEGEGTLIFMIERLVLAKVGDSEWMTTSVPGLFHKDRDGNYFHATVESAFPLIRDTLVNHTEIRTSYRRKKIEGANAFTPEELMQADEESWEEVENRNKNSDAPLS